MTAPESWWKPLGLIEHKRLPKQYVQITYMCRRNDEHDEDRFLGSARLYTFDGAPRVLKLMPAVDGAYPVEEGRDKLLFLCITCNRNKELSMDRAFAALDVLAGELTKTDPRRTRRVVTRDV